MARPMTKTGADIPVRVEAPALVVAPTAPATAAKVGDKNIPPDTTAADDLRTASQRKINLIWEVTQAVIAVTVTAATLWVAGQMAIKSEGDSAAFLLLSNAFFVVITAYIQRTNHTRTGGVRKDDVGR